MDRGVLFRHKLVASSKSARIIFKSFETGFIKLWTVCRRSGRNEISSSG